MRAEPKTFSFPDCANAGIIKQAGLMRGFPNRAIDEFYENYNNRKDKAITQTRREAEEFIKNREDTTSGGTSWERISKLVDLSGKGQGGGASGTPKARMRELLLSLRKDEKAPGATGY